MLPHLIFVPGLLCDGDVWEQQARSLRALASIDIVDHGTIDSLGGMAEALLQRAPDRFALAGHSMGARVAFEVIRRAPERVVKLALLNTACRPRVGEEGEREKAGRYSLLEKARNEGMRPMGLQWLQNMVHPDRIADNALVESILRMIVRKPPAIFAAQIKALLDRPDAMPVLPGISCPTLVLCGRQDLWNPVSGHEEMAAKIPKSKLVMLENCGHMSTMERPDDVTSALMNWAAEG